MKNSRNASSRLTRNIAAVVILGAALCASLFFGPLGAAEHPFSELEAHQQLSEDILRELVAYRTTSEHREEIRKALEALAERLVEAGFAPQDVQLVDPPGGNFGLVTRYRGIGEKRPMLVLAHIDVVQATPDAWTFPPFTLGQKDGYYLGRGTEDNKAGVTQIVSNFIRLKREGWMPGRDIIAAISGDEETTGAVAAWLAGEGRGLVDAEFAINTDAGWGEYDEAGKPRAFWVQTSEKLYQTWELTARNEGGHSSLPRRDNAIRDLAIAITRLTDHAFPVQLDSTTRMALQRSASLYPGELSGAMLALADDPGNTEAAERLSATDPGFNAALRTTCVPTMLSGGHAENALPRDATVTVNCRIMPGAKATEIEAAMASLVGDLDIEFKAVYEGIPSDVSELPDALLEGIETLVGKRWGELPVIPSMSPGATDGLFYRNAGIPVFGISALFGHPEDARAHGLDERIGIREFHESVAFWYEMLRLLGQ